jgi:hypothetical protein
MKYEVTDWIGLILTFALSITWAALPIIGWIYYLLPEFVRIK